jgi:hypothetical protein
MIVDDGKFHLFESWTATKGKALNLFVIGLSLIVILALAESVAWVLTIIVASGFAGSAAGGPAHLAEMIRDQPQLLLSRMAPALVIIAAVWTFLAGCATAVMAAPWAKAYRDVALPDPSAHFA